MEESTELLLNLPSTWGGITPKRAVSTGVKNPRKRKRPNTNHVKAPHTEPPDASCEKVHTMDTTEKPQNYTLQNHNNNNNNNAVNDQEKEDSHSTVVDMFRSEYNMNTVKNNEVTSCNASVAFESVSEKIHDIYAAILQAPQTNKNSNGTRNMIHQRDCIDLESIVSNIPFLETMQSMFSFDHGSSGKYTVPIITKDYEEMYMRESFLAEDVDCIMGVNCECMFVDIHMPFVGTRFWSEQFIHDVNKDSCASNKMCVLCCRKNTQQLFYDLIFSGVRFNGYIQLYGNICGIANEYAKEAVLICPPNGPVACMPFPVVAHQRNRYSVIMKNGVKYMKQHKVYYEDFHRPSLST
jgi:hypothetical protein